MEKTTSSHYNINYHFVWCPKYRKEFLVGEIASFTQNIIETICSSKKWKLLELQIMPDHIHLFISTPPYENPTGIIKVLKGTTAIQIFKKFPKNRLKFRKGHIWSPSYYVGTAGTVTAETIKKYIKEQERENNRNSSPKQVKGSPCDFGGL